MDSYTTIREPASGELVQKRSRFLARIAPADSPEAALAVVEEMRAAHREARHHVWAYLLRDGSRRYSDDGEPQGTGGVPVLEVLAKSGLCDCALVVTRYFGGVLLGAGGLVRAYSGAARLAVQQARPVTLCQHQVCSVKCAYHQLGKLASLIEESGTMLDSDYHEEITLRFALPLDRVDRFEHQLRELTSGSVALGRFEIRYLEPKAAF